MIWDEIDGKLEDLRAQGLQRYRKTVNTACGGKVEVARRPLLSFCSNDYLGLAAEPELIEVAREMASRWGVGSGSSHLLGGHLVPHEALEQRLAKFVGSERALYFQHRIHGKYRRSAGAYWA